MGKRNRTNDSQAEPPSSRVRPVHFLFGGILLFGGQILYLQRSLLLSTYNNTDWSQLTTDLSWAPPLLQQKEGERPLLSQPSTTRAATTKEEAVIAKEKVSPPAKEEPVMPTEKLSPTPEERSEEKAPIVGTFNGYDVSHHSDWSQHELYSQYHCVGESYREPFNWRREHKILDVSWQTRSCQFDLFCFDMDSKQFVIYLNDKESYPHLQPGSTTTTDFTQHSFPQHADVTQTIYTNRTPHLDDPYPFRVSIGGINTKWTQGGSKDIAWFPEVRRDLPKSVYLLPSNVTIMPFHSLNAVNPGHLLWDDFLPLYVLMELFGKTYSSSASTATDEIELLLLRYVLPTGPLWASCDFRDDRQAICIKLLNKFGSLMIRNPKARPMTTQLDAKLTLNDDFSLEASSQTNVVCARHGLAGLGSLTDHGIDKGHGWQEDDYQNVYNPGRGGQFWRFRSFMMSNLGLPVTTAPPPTDPVVIVVSNMSSAKRGINFIRQVNALKTAFPDETKVKVEEHHMSSLTIKEQAEVVSRAGIYITGCGGGAATASFLPRGSSLLIFFAEGGGLENNKYTGKPARLDWDYFNNMGYSRVHWVPMGKIGKVSHSAAMVELVRHEISLIQRARTEYDENRIKGSIS